MILIGGICSQVVAQTDKHFLENLHSFTERVEKIEFKIYSNDLNQSLKEKLHLEKTPSVYAIIYWHKNNKENIRLVGDEKMPLGIKVILREIFLNKSKIVLGKNYKNWKSGYSLLLEEKNKLLLQKINEDNEKSQKEIIYTDDKIIVTSIHKDRKSKTEYFLENAGWTFGKKIITTVNREIKEQFKIIKIKASIRYGKLKYRKWVPQFLELNTKQILENNNKEIQREIKESYHFSNFKIIYSD